MGPSGNNKLTGDTHIKTKHVTINKLAILYQMGLGKCKLGNYFTTALKSYDGFGLWEEQSHSP